MQATEQRTIKKRDSGDKIWITSNSLVEFAPENRPFNYEVLESEEQVGQALFDELASYAAQKDGDISIVLLGGRGGQAMYRIISRLAEAGEIDDLLGRLNVFTQDALAPMRMNSALSFVRDFERLLGPTFF